MDTNNPFASIKLNPVNPIQPSGLTLPSGYTPNNSSPWSTLHDGSTPTQSPYGGPSGSTPFNGTTQQGPQLNKPVQPETPTGSQPDSTQVSSPYGATDPNTQKMIESISSMGLSLKTMLDKSYADSQALSSSESSSAETLLANAKTAYEKQLEANKASADANFNPENDPTILAEKNQRNSAVNTGRGGIDQSAAFRVMDKQISDNIKDLESRKNAALLDGNSRAYATYSDAIEKATIQQQNARRDQINATQAFISGYQNVAKMMQDTVTSAHNMTMDELNYKVSLGNLEVSRANSVSEAMLKSAETSYYNFQANGKLNDGSVPAGWANTKIGATAYASEVSNAATQVAHIGKDVIDAQGNDSAAQAAGYTALYEYADERATALAGIVDRDTLMKMYGFEPGATATSGRAVFGNHILTPVGALNKSTSFWDFLFGGAENKTNSSVGAIGGDKNTSFIPYTLAPDGSINSINGIPVIPTDGKKKT